jgi:hypothetical protein
MPGHVDFYSLWESVRSCITSCIHIRHFAERANSVRTKDFAIYFPTISIAFHASVASPVISLLRARRWLD